MTTLILTHAAVTALLAAVLLLVTVIQAATPARLRRGTGAAVRSTGQSAHPERPGSPCGLGY